MINLEKKLNEVKLELMALKYGLFHEDSDALDVVDVLDKVIDDIDATLNQTDVLKRG